MIPLVPATLRSFFTPSKPAEPVKKETVSVWVITYLCLIVLSFFSILIGSVCTLFFPVCIPIVLVSLAILLSLCACAPCIGYYAHRSTVKTKTEEEQTTVASKILRKTLQALPSQEQLRSFFSPVHQRLKSIGNGLQAILHKK